MSQLSPAEAQQLLAQNPPRGSHTLLQRALAFVKDRAAAAAANASPVSDAAAAVVAAAAQPAAAAASPDCAPAPPTAAQPRQLRRLQRYSSELPEAIDTAAQLGSPAASNGDGEAAQHVDAGSAPAQPGNTASDSGPDRAEQQQAGAAAADEQAAGPSSGNAHSEQGAAVDSPAQRQQKRRRHSVPGPPADHRPRSGKMRSLGEIAAAGPSSFPTASAAALSMPQQQQQQQAAVAGGSDASVAAQPQVDQPPAGIQQLAQPLVEAVQDGSLMAGQPPAGEQPSSGRKGSRKQAKVLALPPPDGRLVAELSWADAQAILDANYKRQATAPYAQWLVPVPASLNTSDVLIGLHILTVSPSVKHGLTLDAPCLTAIEAYFGSGTSEAMSLIRRGSEQLLLSC